MSMGKMIKKFRKERGLTQNELALHAGVSFSTINRIEKGEKNITFDTVSKVLSVFGYSIDIVKAHEKINIGEEDSGRV